MSEQHKVLGSKEALEKKLSRFNTWCDFCSRKINKDEPVLEGKCIPTEEWMGEKTFIIHQDCNQVRNRIHKVEWLRQREAGKKTNGKKQTKKVFNTDYDDRVVICKYCQKKINGEYVKDGKQKRFTYHQECLKVKQNVLNQSKQSIRASVGFR